MRSMWGGFRLGIPDTSRPSPEVTSRTSFTQIPKSAVRVMHGRRRRTPDPPKHTGLTRYRKINYCSFCHQLWPVNELHSTTPLRTSTCSSTSPIGGLASCSRTLWLTATAGEPTLRLMAVVPPQPQFLQNKWCKKRTSVTNDIRDVPFTTTIGERINAAQLFW